MQRPAQPSKPLSALDRDGATPVRSEAATRFHVHLRAALGAGAKFAAPTLVKALRAAYQEMAGEAADPFGARLAQARALATVYAAWMETLDTHEAHSELRSVKHLSDAGWMEAQMIVASQAGVAAREREALLQRGSLEALDFVLGDGSFVPHRNDLAWLSGFASGLQAAAARRARDPETRT